MGSFIVHFLRQIALSLFNHKHLLPRVRGKYGREEKKKQRNYFWVPQTKAVESREPGITFKRGSPEGFRLKFMR